VSDISQKDLRNSLDVLRDDNKKLQIDIDLKTKQVAASQKDKDKKMETYGEIIKQFEERQAQMKKDADLHQLHLTNLKSSIIQITQQVSF
jgi:dihydroneopterin aldolase